MRFLHVIIMAVFMGLPAAMSAADSAAEKALLADRVALALTGLPASDSVKKDFAEGRLSYRELVDRFKTTDAFKLHYARYWTETLKIEVPPNFEIFRDKGHKTLFDRLRRGSDVNNSRSLSPKHWTHKTCSIDGKNLSLSNTFIYRLDLGSGLNPTSKDDAVVFKGKTYKDALQDCACYKDSGVVDGTCNECNIVTLNPYWDPSQTVIACRLLIEDEFCGPDLSKCFLNPDSAVRSFQPRNDFYRDLTYGFTMEPGFIMAHIVSADESWDNIVKGKKAAVNGATAWLIGHPEFGQEYIDNYLPRANDVKMFPDRQSNPVFSNAVPSESHTFQAVDAGPLAQGILTTMAFQASTNGWRAKANRVHEALRCRQFQPPEGSIPPSDIEDLAERPYCKHCHATLEPMAQFFGRWPQFGANFLYDPEVALAPDAKDPHALHATGVLAGQRGAGLKDFANILAKLDSFNECAVIRAFEFVFGRLPTADEKVSIIDPLTRQFVANDKRLWPVLQEMIALPLFTGGL